jgi:glycosyltransferase involved in cell wall biosynthesis
MQTVLPSALRQVRPDLCHFTNYLAPVQCPCPSIVTIYDMTVFITPRFHTFKKFVLDRTLIPTVARRADAIVTVSNSARDDIVRYLKVPRDKVKVIPGAASSHFRPTTDPAKLEDVRRRYGLDAPYILYVGTIEPRKNLVRLAQAFARLKKRGLSHKLLIVGQAGWQVGPVYAEVERLGLTRDVIFTGYVPLEDLPPLYTLAESLAFPSLYEGFGLPVIEAMACGTPVVTSRSSSLGEISGDAALLIDPLSVDELEEALYRIHADPSLRACLREKGVARAALFTWETTARATLDLYKQVRSRSVGVLGQEAGVRERERHESVVGDY